MGGSPKIQGGMTYDQQSQLLKEERDANRSDELERRQWAEDAEKKRLEFESEEKARLKAEENARIAKAEMGEQAAIDEAQAQSESAGSTGIAGSNTRVLDLWESVYKNVSNA